MPMITIPKKLHLAAFAAMIASASAANITVVNTTGYQLNIGASAAGSKGNIVLDPVGVLGWANYRTTLTPAAGEFGGTAFTLSQIGTFTLESLADCRFRDAWGATPTTETIGVRGRVASGLSDNEGFRLAFVPGAPGSYRLTVHMGDNMSVVTTNAPAVNYAVTQDGNPVTAGTGTLPTGTGTSFDEGPVTFNFTVANATEAAATWNFDFTRTTGTLNGQALFITGASLSPADPVFSYTVPATVQSTGAPVNFSIPFTNGGSTQNLTITSVTPGGLEAAEFAVTNFTATPVTPGGSGTIDVTFTPTLGSGPYAAELTVASNDSANPSIVIPITANVAENPNFVVTNPATIQSNGAPVTLSIPFTNSGSSLPLNISSITPFGTDETLFTVNSFTTPVAAGGSGTISVTFTPTAGGNFSASLDVVSDDEQNPAVVIPLTARVSDPGLLLSAARIDYGTLATNPGAQTATLTVTNTGANTALTVTPTLLGTAGPFSITSAPAAPIAPGASDNIVVTFAPGAETGKFGALLSITSDAPVGGSATVPIVAQVTDGTALPTALVVTNADFNAGTYSSASSTAPAGWTSSPAATPGNYGQTAPGTPNLTSIAAHFQARGGNYLQQNLSTANTGLTPANTTAVTVGLKQGYRNDTVTAGPIMMRVSLWDLAGNTEVTGRNLVIEDTGVISGTGANQLSTTSVTMPVTSAATGDLALRITHLQPGAAATFTATSIIDDITVSISGTLATPFQSWALAAGLDGTAGKENGATDDPDKDGVSNFEEFAFGADPLSGGSRGLTAVVAQDTDSDTQKELLITLAVRSGATFSGSPAPSATKDGILYQVQGSSGLSAWDQTVQGPLATAVVPSSLPASAPSGYEYKTFRLAGSNGLPSRGFLRASAEVAP